MGGREGSRTDARPALRHRRLRGHPLLRHGDRGPAVFRHQRPHRPAAASRPSCTTCRSRTPRGAARRRRSSSSARTGCAPATSARSRSAATGTMGLFPLDAPVDVAIAVWEWGAYLGDEGTRNGIRAKVSSLAADLQRLADPARQGVRPVPQLDPREDREPQGRLRGGDPPRRPRLRLRGLGREHLHRARRASIVTPPQTAGDPRRHQPQVDHPDRARPRLRGRRARRRARRAVPGRGGLPHRHRRRARARARGRRPRHRRRASPARHPGVSTTRSTAVPAYATGSTRRCPSGRT